MYLHITRYYIVPLFGSGHNADNKQIQIDTMLYLYILSIIFVQVFNDNRLNNKFSKLFYINFLSST